MRSSHCGSPRPHQGKPIGVCELINRAHGGQELFTPYTPEGLAERLDRLPERYGFGQVRRTERAALGVWHAGDRHVSAWKGAQREARRALVLDYGFIPGGESELEALLRDTCRRCLEQGIEERALFTSDMCLRRSRRKWLVPPRGWRDRPCSPSAAAATPSRVSGTRTTRPRRQRNADRIPNPNRHRDGVG